MKRNYKKIITAGLLGAMTASILVPILISAQTENVGQGAKGFCDRLSIVSSKIEQRIDDREAKLEAKRIEILNKINERQTERDAKLVEKRAKWDANRNEHFAKLEEKAQNNAQQQALLIFKKAVNTAITTRRAAIDAAIQDFRQGVKEAVAVRKSAVDAAIETFLNSVKLALEKAESNCENGVDPTIVRENLRADLKAAREKFVKDRQEIEKLRTQMESLIAARKEAIEKAIQDFKVALEKAKTDFKAVFPSSFQGEAPQD